MSFPCLSRFAPVVLGLRVRFDEERVRLAQEYREKSRRCDDGVRWVVLDDASRRLRRVQSDRQYRESQANASHSFSFGSVLTKMFDLWSYEWPRGLQLRSG